MASKILSLAMLDPDRCPNAAPGTNSVTNSVTNGLALLFMIGSLDDPIDFIGRFDYKGTMRSLTLMFVLAAGVASAQDVDELIAKHVAARGGQARLKAIQTIRIERTVAATFNDIDVVIYKKRPGLYRSEQKPEGGTSATVRGFADVAWETVNGKTAVRTGAGPAEQREVDGDFDGFLVDYRDKGHAIVLEGRQRVGATDAWKLKVTLKSGATRYVYLDADTLLERRHETSIEVAPNRRVATTITFGDWREVGGVKFPFAIDEERDAPGQTFVIYTKRIEVNVPMEDTIFRMP
jgi:hypothetical protein